MSLSGRSIIPASLAQMSMETQAVLWTLAVIGLTLVGAVVVMLLRRRIFTSGLDAPGTMLDDLRASRDRGEMTDEEYAAARQAIVRKVSGEVIADVSEHRPRPVVRDDGLVARPGYDLTGEPLPKQTNSDQPDG
jgi:hypothetical protein